MAAARWQQNYEIYRKYLENIVNMYRARHDLQMFTELLLSVFAIIIFAIFAIRPTLVTVAGLWKDIQTKQDTITQMDAKITQLNAAQEIYDRNRAGIALLHEAIPNQASPQLFIRQVEGLVQKHGVVLAGLTVDGTVLVGPQSVLPPVEENSPTLAVDADTVPVSVRVTGDYTNLQAFLEELEKMRRPLYPDIIVFAVNEGDTGRVLGVSVEGRIPYMQQEVVGE